MTEGTNVVRRSSPLLTAACIFALVGVFLSALHFLAASPLLFSVFMIFGQGAFGVAMILYGIVIFRDLRTRKVL